MKVYLSPAWFNDDRLEAYGVLSNVARELTLHMCAKFIARCHYQRRNLQDYYIHFPLDTI